MLTHPSLQQPNTGNDSVRIEYLHIPMATNLATYIEAATSRTEFTRWGPFSCYSGMQHSHYHTKCSKVSTHYKHSLQWKNVNLRTPRIHIHQTHKHTHLCRPTAARTGVGVWPRMGQLLFRRGLFSLLETHVGTTSETSGLRHWHNTASGNEWKSCVCLVGGLHSCVHVHVTVIWSRWWLDLYPGGGGGIWLRSTGSPSLKALITLQNLATTLPFFWYAALSPAASAFLYS